jgi:hypothetical protein
MDRVQLDPPPGGSLMAKMAHCAAYVTNRGNVVAIEWGDLIVTNIANAFHTASIEFMDADPLSHS